MLHGRDTLCARRKGVRSIYGRQPLSFHAALPSPAGSLGRGLSDDNVFVTLVPQALRKSFQHRVSIIPGLRPPSQTFSSSQHAVLHLAAVIPALSCARAPVFHVEADFFGSQQLGIPTANIPLSGLSVGGHEDVESGVYFGWAGLSPSKATDQHPPGTESKYKHMTRKVYEGLNSVLFGGSGMDGDSERDSWSADKGAVYPMVMSIGWNPFYKNTVRSVEVHIMHHFETDFYDSHMNLSILGFIRPEYDYVSKESLIEDIKTDIDVAGRSLSRPAYAKLYKDPYLLDFKGKEEVIT